MGIMPILKRITLTTQKEVFLITKKDLMVWNIAWNAACLALLIFSLIAATMAAIVLIDYGFLAIITSMIMQGLVISIFFSIDKVRDFWRRLQNTNELYKKRDCFDLREREYQELLDELHLEESRLLDERYSSNS